MCNICKMCKMCKICNINIRKKQNNDLLFLINPYVLLYNIIKWGKVES